MDIEVDVLRKKVSIEIVSDIKEMVKNNPDLSASKKLQRMEMIIEHKLDSFAEKVAGLQIEAYKKVAVSVGKKEIIRLTHNVAEDNLPF